MLDPTVIASATLAGEEVDALAFALPAAIEYVTPEAIELRTALSSAVDTPPPRLMLATAGLMRLAVTQSTPAMTPDVEPEPLQLSTRTANKRTLLATPYVDPPIVPATWVPCPLQSTEFPPNASKAANARPPN